MARGLDEDMPSLGGVTGGAGTRTTAGAGSWTVERAAAGVVRPAADPGRESSCDDAKEVLLKLLELALSCSKPSCFRVLDSLAVAPRRRRNGMAVDHMRVR